MKSIWFQNIHFLLFKVQVPIFYFTFTWKYIHHTFTLYFLHPSNFVLTLSIPDCDAKNQNVNKFVIRISVIQLSLRTSTEYYWELRFTDSRLLNYNILLLKRFSFCLPVIFWDLVQKRPLPFKITSWKTYNINYKK